jgi:hypothetical protein
MKEASRKIQDVDVQQLWNDAPTYNIDDLRVAVTKMVEDARAPNQSILRNIPKMGRGQLLKTITNFYLKGCGLGVK